MVCLNPQAATESRPIPIKVEALGERGTIDSPELQDVVSPVADGSPQGKFLTSLTNTFDEVFGLNPGLDLDTNSEKTQKKILTESPTSTGAKPKMKTGKGNSAGIIRVTNLPYEESGRLTRKKAKSADVSISPVTVG